MENCHYGPSSRRKSQCQDWFIPWAFSWSSYPFFLKPIKQLQCPIIESRNWFTPIPMHPDHLGSFIKNNDSHFSLPETLSAMVWGGTWTLRLVRPSQVISIRCRATKHGFISSKFETSYIRHLIYPYFIHSQILILTTFLFVPLEFG